MRSFFSFSVWFQLKIGLESSFLSKGRIRVVLDRKFLQEYQVNVEGPRLHSWPFIFPTMHE